MNGIRAALSRSLSALRAALLAGGLVMLPIGVTIWVLSKLVAFADSTIKLVPAAWQPEALLGVPLPGLGVLMSLIGLSLVGFAMRYYAGQRALRAMEALLQRVPLASSIYQGVKQLLDTVFAQQGKHFSDVVLIEYPRRGVYSVAFVTNRQPFVALPELGEIPLVSVFLPTTPNPTSGFFMVVPETELQRIDMSVEEAFKLVMSAGIVVPGGPARQIRPLRPATAPAGEAATTDRSDHRSDDMADDRSDDNTDDNTDEQAQNR
jgi:uncharacterized membrane protein